jgi:hypothetical protein
LVGCGDHRRPRAPLGTEDERRHPRIAHRARKAEEGLNRAEVVDASRVLGWCEGTGAEGIRWWGGHRRGDLVGREVGENHPGAIVEVLGFTEEGD